ncbi:unnamed protein product [Amoebophrya sp. A120]|nr:unnamed protein product [Amoebophrya sp. A120]|eukprot:GSA120T00000642001.1
MMSGEIAASVAAGAAFLSKEQENKATGVMTGEDQGTSAANTSSLAAENLLFPVENENDTTATAGTSTTAKKTYEFFEPTTHEHQEKATTHAFFLSKKSPSSSPNAGSRGTSSFALQPQPRATGGGPPPGANNAAVGNKNIAGAAGVEGSTNQQHTANYTQELHQQHFLKKPLPPLIAQGSVLGARSSRYSTRAGAASSSVAGGQLSAGAGAAAASTIPLGAPAISSAASSTAASATSSSGSVVVLPAASNNLQPSNFFNNAAKSAGAPFQNAPQNSPPLPPFVMPASGVDQLTVKKKVSPTTATAGGSSSSTSSLLAAGNNTVLNNKPIIGAGTTMLTSSGVPLLSMSTSRAKSSSPPGSTTIENQHVPELLPGNALPNNSTNTNKTFCNFDPLHNAGTTIGQHLLAAPVVDELENQALESSTRAAVLRQAQLRHLRGTAEVGSSSSSSPGAAGSPGTAVIIPGGGGLIGTGAPTSLNSPGGGPGTGNSTPPRQLSPKIQLQLPEIYDADTDPLAQQLDMEEHMRELAQQFGGGPQHLDVVNQLRNLDEDKGWWGGGNGGSSGFDSSDSDDDRWDEEKWNDQAALMMAAAGAQNNNKPANAVEFNAAQHLFTEEPNEEEIGESSSSSYSSPTGDTLAAEKPIFAANDMDEQDVDVEVVAGQEGQNSINAELEHFLASTTQQDFSMLYHQQQGNNMKRTNTDFDDHLHIGNKNNKPPPGLGNSDDDSEDSDDSNGSNEEILNQEGQQNYSPPGLGSTSGAASSSLIVEQGEQGHEQTSTASTHQRSRLLNNSRNLIKIRGTSSPSSLEQSSSGKITSEQSHGEADEKLQFTFTAAMGASNSDLRAVPGNAEELLPQRLRLFAAGAPSTSSSSSSTARKKSSSPTGQIEDAENNNNSDEEDFDADGSLSLKHSQKVVQTLKRRRIPDHIDTDDAGAGAVEDAPAGNNHRSVFHFRDRESSEKQAALLAGSITSSPSGAGGAGAFGSRLKLGHHVRNPISGGMMDGNTLSFWRNPENAFRGPMLASSSPTGAAQNGGGGGSPTSFYDHPAAFDSPMSCRTTSEQEVSVREATSAGKPGSRDPLRRIRNNDVLDYMSGVKFDELPDIHSYRAWARMQEEKGKRGASNYADGSFSRGLEDFFANGPGKELLARDLVETGLSPDITNELLRLLPN